MVSDLLMIRPPTPMFFPNRLNIIFPNDGLEEARLAVCEEAASIHRVMRPNSFSRASIQGYLYLGVSYGSHSPNCGYCNYG